VANTKRVGHYVVSTHWDREWYESFQDFRFRLVRLLDELLDTMRQDPKFRYFQTDGQSIIIEDYLEVRPERADEVRALARNGQLRIGPWYVLPDEFLVCGESLIRNLQFGIKVASRYGQPSRVGFVCDLFGHNSQLPQILRGFRIDNAFVWRGGNDPTHGALFRWQAADGSEVLTYRFSGYGGYCTYDFAVRKAREADRTVTLEEGLEGLRWVVDHETQRCPTPAFLLFDGGDHIEIDPLATRLLDEGNKAFNDVELVHSHLEGFVEDLREQRDAITRVVQGELRDPGMQGEETWLIPGVLSSRIPIKLANARCETELCLWAEPFSTFAGLAGREYPTTYLELAWRYLLQNQPHDSICTCSIDQVHKDMEYRSDQAIGISSHITRDALRHMAERVPLPEMNEPDMALVVFNPSADPIDGPVDLTLRFPSKLETVYHEFFGFEPKIGFRLFDADGGELPYQYVGHRRQQSGLRRRFRKFPAPDVRHEVDVSVAVRVPAYGFARVMCRPVKEPTRYLGSMAVNDHAIANEHLEVSVNGNGTLKVTDKRSGQVFDRLLTLEDCADIGDGWYHGVAVQDQVFTSIASPAEVALVADGIAKATLMIRVTMQVPERFLFDAFRRSERLAPLVVTHYVTLRQGHTAVEVRTVVENTIRDHRLRVLLPSGAEATTYLSDSVFDVVERPIALRADNAQYKELEVETRPQRTWTAVHDHTRGVALVAGGGLLETAIRDVPERPIALTLLRSFIKAVGTSGQEGGEIQGTHEFRYQIVPLAGKPDVAALCRMGQYLAAGVRLVQIEPWMRQEQPAGDPRSFELSPVHSFLNIGSAEVVVTAVQRLDGEEAVTIRMFNPQTKSIEVPIELPCAGDEACLTDLEGNAGDPLECTRGRLSVTLQPKQITTIRVPIRPPEDSTGRRGGRSGKRPRA